MFVSNQDFIMDGKGHGDVGSALGELRFDTGLLRPYFDDNDRQCVLVNTGRYETIKKDGRVVTNANGTPKRVAVHEKAEINDLIMNRGMTKLTQNATVLTKEQWITLTSVVRLEFRNRLRAWSDLMSASSFGGFDGMSTMVMEYQTMSDPGEAIVDFDGMTEGRNDQPLFKLEGLPLPITHADFWFPERMLAISRKNGIPLNTRMAEAAGRRIAESVEKTLIGTLAGPTLGDQASGAAGIAYGRTPSVYGYLNHPARMTKTDVTTPDGTNAATTVDDVLAMLDTARTNNFFGPFMLYHSTDWDKYLDDDYSIGADAGSKTLRNRLREIDDIQDVRRLDNLAASADPFTFLLVQMTSDVVQAVNGMDITTVQWPSMGGMRTNFKVMAIQVPLITPDYDDRCGILQATTA